MELYSGTGVGMFNRSNSYLMLGTNNTERMRIDSSGNLLVGHTSAEGDSSGTTLYQNGQTVHKADGAYALELVRSTSDGEIVRFRKDGTTVGSIGTNTGNIYLSDGARGIAVSGGTVYGTYSTGDNADGAQNLGSATQRWNDLWLSGGVYLGGTGAANLLDDYEEGTWTPEIYYQNATDQGNATDVTQTGYYTKIGRLVTLNLRLIWNITGSPAADNIGVKNLPFIGFGDTFSSAGTAFPVNNNTTINTLLLGKPASGGSLTICESGDMVGNLGNQFGSGNNKEIRATLTYFTSQ
jgi:hypothetical protein